jgi:uncharacterized protein
MRMNEIGYEGPPPIDSYGGGGFRLSGVFHVGGLALTPSGAEVWAVDGPEAMTVAAFQTFIDRAAEVDVLLVGMGTEIAPLPAEARAALEAAGIGVEIMSTPSACRTFNVLLAEDRLVAAALVAV